MRFYKVIRNSSTGGRLRRDIIVASTKNLKNVVKMMSKKFTDYNVKEIALGEVVDSLGTYEHGYYIENESTWLPEMKKFIKNLQDEAVLNAKLGNINKFKKFFKD